jgi:hypothetical protein
MTLQLPARLRSWLLGAFFYESPDQAADAMADATRWGWLPALSGVAAAAEQVRVKSPETASGQTHLSG